jgi:NADPH:quinone reductase-like Zn-dependent oxidoreductase
MQAAVVNVLGEAPKYQLFPDPVAEEGEVLIRVRAAGLHPIVKALASGSHYASANRIPAVPGVDGVSVLEDGGRVYFLFVRKPWGTMAERAAAARAMCIPVPDRLEDVQAAAAWFPERLSWCWGRRV